MIKGFRCCNASEINLPPSSLTGWVLWHIRDSDSAYLHTTYSYSKRRPIRARWELCRSA